MTIRTAILAALRYHKWSRYDLARASGLRITTVYRALESRNPGRGMSTRTADAMLEALGLEVRACSTRHRPAPKPRPPAPAHPAPPAAESAPGAQTDTAASAPEDTNPPVGQTPPPPLDLRFPDTRSPSPGTEPPG